MNFLIKHTPICIESPRFMSITRMGSEKSIVYTSGWTNIIFKSSRRFLSAFSVIFWIKIEEFYLRTIGFIYSTNCSFSPRL